MDIQITPDCGVYVVRHISSNSAYVGASAHLRKRKWKHLYSMSRGQHPNKDMQARYDISATGNSAWECTTLETCTREELADREQFWIDAYKPEFNTKNAGAGHHTQSAETRRRVSESKIGEKHPLHKGFYITPFGIFPSSYLAEKAIGGLIVQPTIRRICRNPDKIINRCAFSHSAYLQTHYDESVIGRDWRSLGFWFEPKA